MRGPIRSQSPYGIRDPAAMPPQLPRRPGWLTSLLHWADVYTSNHYEDVRRDITQTASGQTVYGPDSYRTKLRTEINRGTRSDAILPLTRPSTDITMPWPSGFTYGRPNAASDQASVSGHYGRARISGRDWSHTTPEATEPIQHPGNQDYHFIGPNHPERHSVGLPGAAVHRQDFIPIGGGRREHGLDYGPVPWRVPLIRKLGLSLMAGPMQWASQQQYSGMMSVAGPSGSILMAPPVWSDRLRGTRGASGILQRVQGSGTAHVPSAFVPAEVR